MVLDSIISLEADALHQVGATPLLSHLVTHTMDHTGVFVGVSTPYLGIRGVVVDDLTQGLPVSALPGTAEGGGKLLVLNCKEEEGEEGEEGMINVT